MSEAHRPLRRQPKFTPQVLAAVPVWRALGASTVEIAAVLGTTEAGLRMACSRRGISLSRNEDDPLSSSLRRRFTDRQWGVLSEEAQRRGTTPSHLVTLIVSAVVDEGLFAAVLGDYDDLEEAG